MFSFNWSILSLSGSGNKNFFFPPLFFWSPFFLNFIGSITLGSLFTDSHRGALPGFPISQAYLNTRPPRTFLVQTLHARISTECYPPPPRHHIFLRLKPLFRSPPASPRFHIRFSLLPPVLFRPPSGRSRTYPRPLFFYSDIFWDGSCSSMTVSESAPPSPYFLRKSCRTA